MEVSAEEFALVEVATERFAWEDINMTSSFEAEARSSFIGRSGSLIGFFITFILCSISSWRVISHMSGCNLTVCSEKHRHPYYEQPRPLQEGMTPRRIFHLLLWLAMLSEMIGYLFYSKYSCFFGEDCQEENKFDDEKDDDDHDVDFQTKAGYVFVVWLGRSVFEYDAFAVVTLDWFRSMSQVTADHVSPSSSTTRFTWFSSVTSLRIALVVLTGCSILLGCHAFLDVVTLMASSSFCKHREDEIGLPVYCIWLDNYHLVQMASMSISWGLHGLLVTTYVVRLKCRVRRLAFGPGLRRSHVASILVPPILCALSYLLRSALLAVMAIYLRQSQEDGTKPNADDIDNNVINDNLGLHPTAWWILEGWIPTVVPACTLLWVLRQRDRRNFTDADEQLLPVPVPAQEVFTAFTNLVYHSGETESLYSDNDSITSNFTRCLSLSGSGGGGLKWQTIGERGLRRPLSPLGLMEEETEEEVEGDAELVEDYDETLPSILFCFK